MALDQQNSNRVDAIIIGGGPAGLAAALGLSRQMFSTVVFDSKEYRNGPTTHMHNMIGFDHEDPETYRTRAREGVAKRYASVSFVDRKVVGLKKLAGEGVSQTLFEAIDETGTIHHGRKVVLATGVRDIFPTLPGYRDAWGSFVFHCLFCHGYEEQGAQHAGILAAESSILTQLPMAVLVARTARRFAEKVTIFTHGSEEFATALREAGIDENGDGLQIETRPIVRLEQVVAVGGSRLLRVHLSPDHIHPDPSWVDVRFLAHAPDTQLTNEWPKMLGMETTSNGTYKLTEGTNESTTRGVFVAGDHALPGKIAQAVSSGVVVAAAIARQLLTPEHC